MLIIDYVIVIYLILLIYLFYLFFHNDYLFVTLIIFILYFLHFKNIRQFNLYIDLLINLYYLYLFLQNSLLHSIFVINDLLINQHELFLFILLCFYDLIIEKENFIFREIFYCLIRILFFISENLDLSVFLRLDLVFFILAFLVLNLRQALCIFIAI
jgi:hypothetical protein